MALSKSITLDSGVVVTYHRLDAVVLGTDGSASATVGAYLSKDAVKVDNKRPALTSTQHWKVSPVAKGDNVWANLYAALKALPAYAEATDI